MVALGRLSKALAHWHACNLHYKNSTIVFLAILCELACRSCCSCPA